MDRATATPRVDGMPGERAERWAEFHHRHAAPSTYVYDFVWDTTAPAEGPFCTDVDGNVLMDFTSHVAAAPLGYNNPKLLDRMADFSPVDPAKIAGQDFYASLGGTVEDPDLPGPTHLMDRITDLTAHYDMDTVFLSNSGAEAVENAIKVCYNRRGHRGVCFEGAFHGRTLGALSLNRSKTVHRKGYPEIAGVMSVPYCACEGECTCGWRTDGPGGNVLADKLHPTQGNTDPEEVAYVVFEPIQGEGGYREPNPEFVADLRAIREEHGIYLVADEIQSGLGRTGDTWAIDHIDLTPDVITGAKGLRVGATVSRRDVFPEERGRLSSTWGAGHVYASMVGALTLDVIADYDLEANAAERGRQLDERLQDADPAGVVDHRGRGLMRAIEFETKAQREAVVEAAMVSGLLTIGCGYKSLRILPPLDVTEREIDLGVDLLLSAIEAAV